MQREPEQRRSRRKPAIAVATVLSLIVGGAIVLADPGANTVGTVIDVELALAQDEADRYEDLASSRLLSVRELSQLYQELDTAIRGAVESGPDTLETVLEQVEAAEQENARILLHQRESALRIVAHLRRAEMLGDRAAVLHEQERAEAGPLTGSWEVVLLPHEQRGAFDLMQTGTIATGTYRLEGGWSGSLQGTLVNRKVYLVRIDSKLGRSMEFEGRLAEDGNTIRGSWLNYELAGQGGGQGQWTATRVDQ